MSIRNAVYGLLRSGYSLEDGIGVQRHFLDSLVQDRKLKESERHLFYTGHDSNFFSSRVIADTLYHRRKGAEYAKFFGDEGKSLRRKAMSLDRQEKEITNIVLRSLIRVGFVDNPRDLNVEEYIDFIKKILSKKSKALILMRIHQKNLLILIKLQKN